MKKSKSKSKSPVSSNRTSKSKSTRASFNQVAKQTKQLTQLNIDEKWIHDSCDVPKNLLECSICFFWASEPI